ncbi:hypothetical protein [uncultured Methanobrevibacter sp.]|uniref:hypothetical protein n=1 Tax=uncultured Methanobrevibacter sp. TaxID=253161 RepID=UPI0025DBFD95|nr:hypothetical protein [uncultured Methanobrevibacter sp.]
MLFKDLEFHDKQTVLKTWRYKILEKTLKLLEKEHVTLYVSALNRYITYLLEDTHYNPKDNVFYEPISRFKFSVDVFSSITYEYVCEHLEEYTVKAGNND